MDCEICGREIGKKVVINLDGMHLIVCDECSSFGEEIKEKKELESKKPSFAGRACREEEPGFDLGFEIVNDYGKVIRKAREKECLTVKELAMKLFEKASTLHRIESQSLPPSNELVKKLEKALSINLRKTISEKAELEQ